MDNAIHSAVNFLAMVAVQMIICTAVRQPILSAVVINQAAVQAAILAPASTAFVLDEAMVDQQFWQRLERLPSRRHINDRQALVQTEHSYLCL